MINRSTALKINPDDKVRKSNAQKTKQKGLSLITKDRNGHSCQLAEDTLAPKITEIT